MIHIHIYSYMYVCVYIDEWYFRTSIIGILSRIIGGISFLYHAFMYFSNFVQWKALLYNYKNKYFCGGKNSPVRTCLVRFEAWVEFEQDYFSSHFVVLYLLSWPKLHEGRGFLVLLVHHCAKHRAWHTAGHLCYKNERTSKGNNDEEQGQAPKLKTQHEQINEIGKDQCWTADQQVTCSWDAGTKGKQWDLGDPASSETLQGPNAAKASVFAASHSLHSL